MKRGGSCESTADCVSGNVCSKWGWCQWTTIYGEEGPSQGAAAPAGQSLSTLSRKFNFVFLKHVYIQEVELGSV